MKYYSLHKCLSYNRYLNILIGGRGIGKTYQLKKYVIEQYLKKKDNLYGFDDIKQK